MTFFARVDKNGKLVVSASDTLGIGLKPGDIVLGDREGDRIVLRSYADIVADGQDRFQALLPTGFDGSLVDSLIADRRAENRSG